MRRLFNTSCQRIMNMRRAFLTVVAGAMCISATHATASEDQQLAWAIFLKPMCDKHIEGFATKSKPAYERMRLRHPDALSSYEESHRTSGSSPPDAQLDGQELQQLHSGCEAALDYMLSDGMPPDPRLATPEQTWKLFIGALHSGNKETLAVCFNPEDRPKYLQALGQLAVAELVELANSFTSFHLTNVSMDEYQQAAVKKSDGTMGLVLFVKSDRGWRISQL
jgi:hypothetical protein